MHFDISNVLFVIGVIFIAVAVIIIVVRATRVKPITPAKRDRFWEELQKVEQDRIASTRFAKDQYQIVLDAQEDNRLQQQRAAKDQYRNRKNPRVD